MSTNLGEPEPLLGVLQTAGLIVRRAGNGVTASVRLDGAFAVCDLAGVVGVLADTGAGLAALDAVHPLRVATSDLTIHLVGTPPPVEAVATAQVVRRGRHSVRVAVEVCGAGSPETVALATAGLAVLDGGQTPTPLTTSPEPGRPGRDLRELLDVGRPVSGISSSSLELEIDHDLRNTFSALNGGVLAAVLARAARTAAAREMGDRACPIQLSVSYVAPGRVGPVVITTQILGMPAGSCLVGVRATDAGADGRVVATATALVGLAS